MEYFWLVLAAIGAGVGTGLAGLSAATVMVPILITLYLCGIAHWQRHSYRISPLMKS